MGQDNNVKETFSIIKGWEVLKEDSIYTQKTMDIIAENLSGDARTILVEKGGKKLKLPVLLYDEEKFIKTPYHYLPYQRAEWYSEDTSLFWVVDRETQKLGKRIDALDIEGLGQEFPRGTNTVVIDLLGSVEETIEQYSGKFRKKVRKVNRGRGEFSFLPSTQEEEEFLKEWSKYWNECDGYTIGTSKDYDLLQHWKTLDLDLTVESIYKGGNFIGLYVLLIVDGKAYGVWAAWKKWEYGRDIDFGYLVNLRRMELCIKRGIKELDLGSSFLAEHKERWATRLVRHGSVGMGYKEVLE